METKEIRVANRVRWRALVVDMQWFGTLFVTGNRLRQSEVTNGVPPGSAIVRGFADNNHGVLCIVFEHPSFPEIEEPVDLANLPRIDTRMKVY